MKEKIEWYQEVLELEPNSKVFFPLARLLAQTGQIEDALNTLQHGIARHPEFIEARLYYIELLYGHGRMPQCQEQVDQLSGLFSGYAGFWEAWGACLASSGKGRDVALALTFLAASFQNSNLTLAQVMELGLQSVLGRKEQVAPAAARAASPAELDSAPEASAVSSTPPTVPPLAELVQSLPAESQAVRLADLAEQARRVAVRDVPQVGDGEERFSLRTRSMAEVLAEQGDFKGALEIYQELALTASTSEETVDLQHRISTLTARLGAAQEETVPQEEVSLPEASAPGKDRLLSLLETLADRLETRAQG